MSQFEVPEAIICSPFEEPTHFWQLEEGEEPEKRAGRRPSLYYHPLPQNDDGPGMGVPRSTTIELKLVNLIRARVKEWRAAGYPGVTATTLELLQYWRRDGRRFRLFFAQLEAAETVIFLNEARPIWRRGSTSRATSRATTRSATWGTRPSAVMAARWRLAPAKRRSWGCWRRGAS